MRRREFIKVISVLSPLQTGVNESFANRHVHADTPLFVLWVPADPHAGYELRDAG